MQKLQLLSVDPYKSNDIMYRSSCKGMANAWLRSYLGLHRHQCCRSWLNCDLACVGACQLLHDHGGRIPHLVERKLQSYSLLFGWQSPKHACSRSIQVVLPDELFNLRIAAAADRKCRGSKSRRGSSDAPHLNVSNPRDQHRGGVPRPQDRSALDHDALVVGGQHAQALGGLPIRAANGKELLHLVRCSQWADQGSRRHSSERRRRATIQSYRPAQGRALPTEARGGGHRRLPGRSLGRRERLPGSQGLGDCLCRLRHI
mmetsp:Transcript_129420/g.322649  ORF Transcript_129420/g.322649 Transcript_129420/m.322649 type:complete len:259 (+) Transcript_129420:95-871(+)